MKKIQLVPGKKYKGTAFINEYGEINFTPSQVGSKPEQKKIIFEDGDLTIYETKNWQIFSLKVDKKLNSILRINSFLKLTDKVLNAIYTYEI